MDCMELISARTARGNNRSSFDPHNHRRYNHSRYDDPIKQGIKTINDPGDFSDKCTFCTFYIVRQLALKLIYIR